jgi:hypothetical protein
MLEIEAASVVSGQVDEETGHLILTTHGGSEIDAGDVSGSIPSESVVNYISASTFTEATPPLSYPDGVSIMWMDNVQSTTNWPTFAGKFGVVRTINMPLRYSDGDSVQTWTRIHGIASTPELWIRAGNNVDGWSSWKKVALDQDVQTINGNITTINGRLNTLESQVNGMLGAWTSYNPVWASTGTQPSIGNGTLTGEYRLVGKTCTMRMSIVAGTTTAFGSGFYSFTVPFTPKNGTVLSAMFRDNSAASHFPCIVNQPNFGLASYAIGTPGGTGLSNTVPAAWAVNDNFVISGSYEVP